MKMQAFLATSNSIDELSSRVAARREELGVTQAELADQIGVSREWVHRFEKGNDGANIASVLRVFDALGLVLATGSTTTVIPQRSKPKEARAMKTSTTRRTSTKSVTERASQHLSASFVLPASLGELKGPATGDVTLPNRLLWNPSRPFDLTNDKRVRSMVRIVLREARAQDDLTTHVNREQLIRNWRTLGLPTYIRDAWEAKFPELAALSEPVGAE